MASFRSHAIWLVVPSLLIIAFPRHSHSTSRFAPLTHEQALEPLIYSHVTIECTISSVRRQSTTLGELGSPSTTPNREVIIRIAELSDVVVLRGSEAPREVQITLALEPEKLIGERLILCCYWLPKLKMFSVPFDEMAFRRDGDRWLGMRSVISASPNSQVSATPQEIDALIQENELSVLADNADVIVIGDVRSVVQSTIGSKSGETYRVEEIVLDVEQSLKGGPLSAPFSFLVSRGPRRTSWHTKTPMSFVAGEKWIAFLRREGSIYYPIGGVNGLLMLRGQRVIVDRTFESSYSRDDVTTTVMEVIDE